ncbi:MAG: sigma-70 family RNA polymerase sigma factor [Nitrospinaceae bacterium]
MNHESIDSSQWVDRYGDVLFRFTLVRVKDVDAAEEIVQNTFLAALGARQSFAGRSTEKSWLFGILKHKIMDHFRQLQRTRTFDLKPEDGPDPSPDEHDHTGHWTLFPKSWNLDPEKAAENQQLLEVLSKCMDGISDKFRRVFVLKEIEGLSSEEICNEFNIKPTNLWVILHRARNQLKKCLDLRWFDKGLD